MKYLYRPTAREELRVQGRYVFRHEIREEWAYERWERYRSTGADAEVWRGEWRATDGARQILSHLLLTSDGVERIVLRISAGGAEWSTLTVTTTSEGLLASQGTVTKEVVLPPLYGFVTPLMSLARLGLPFDIGAEESQVALTYLVRAHRERDEWLHRAAKFGYFPLPMREVQVRGETVTAKGWRMEVRGVSPRNLWFDRHGTLVYGEIESTQSTNVTLDEWRTFG